MRLTCLHIHHVRNVKDISFTPHPQFNLLLGKNGSGKTSILEAIYLLALGRSFRSRQIQPVIMYEREHLTCYGEVKGVDEMPIALGIEKSRDGDLKCKIGGEPCARLSQFATILPVQLMLPETFKLLAASSEERRKFLDWGVFHVEPSFGSLCLQYQRLLKQRNALLKQSPSCHSLAIWDKELALTGEQIALYRQRYLVALFPFIHKILSMLLPDLLIKIDYEQGWNTAFSLNEALSQGFRLDQKMGYTRCGPHRAEITFQVSQFPAMQVLSRGQQKCLICALLLAQAAHLSHHLKKKCLYLIDDLGSELDAINRQKVLAVLTEQKHQVFLTGAEPSLWQDLLDVKESVQMFHVEHGRFLGV